VIVVIVGALLAYFLKNRQDAKARVSAANAAILKQIEPAYETVFIKGRRNTNPSRKRAA